MGAETRRTRRRTPIHRIVEQLSSGASTRSKPRRAIRSSTVIEACRYCDGGPPTRVDPAEVSELRDADDGFLWVDIASPTPDELHTVAEEFALHPLALEGALEPGERPKLDRFPTHDFLVLYDALGAKVVAVPRPQLGGHGPDGRRRRSSVGRRADPQTGRQLRPSSARRVRLQADRRARRWLRGSERAVQRTGRTARGPDPRRRRAAAGDHSVRVRRAPSAA